MEYFGQIWVKGHWERNKRERERERLTSPYVGMDESCGHVLVRCVGLTVQ